jgi:hypothetical protein
MRPDKSKYRILVLSDLNKSARTMLKSTVGLAKMIHGEIDVFHVKKPSDIVSSENQLSAMRTINRKHTEVDREMQDLTKSITEELDMNLKYSFAFGNVKNEIDTYILKSRPDIIVLGKRKPKPFNLQGDGITEFVLNRHNGAIMISADKDCIVPGEEITFSTLNSSGQSFNLEFAEDLMKHIQKPLKSFRILKNSSSAPKKFAPSDRKTIEYVFESNDGAIKNISNYLSKTSINILSIDRTQKNQDSTENLTETDINSVIGKLDVTFLLSGRQKYDATKQE